MYKQRSPEEMIAMAGRVLKGVSTYKAGQLAKSILSTYKSLDQSRISHPTEEMAAMASYVLADPLSNPVSRELAGSVLWQHNNLGDRFFGLFRFLKPTATTKVPSYESN